MGDLREKTARLILTEGQFNMKYYKPGLGLVYEPECGTACCIAGNICLASGMSLPELQAIPWVKVEDVARDLWEAEYGYDEASRLQFDEDGWGDDLSAVTPEEAVAHLYGSDPVVHNYKEDEE